MLYTALNMYILVFAFEHPRSFWAGTLKSWDSSPGEKIMVDEKHLSGTKREQWTSMFDLKSMVSKTRVSRASEVDR